jgi:diaminohydroxyphosphoribosylaminopyrimidine deaminase/5-amino-6-(5-phosphoribosylamino)uracil reductase
MARALFHAERGAGRTSPNPMVGAIVVTQDGVVVGQGYHERAGEAHAEVRALESAGILARGATLYCTLEPCAHLGRTGPCAPRIVESGIARVVASIEDPNPLVQGRGFAYLQEHGVDVCIGPGAGRSRALNRAFFTLMREGRPFVILKAAISADGYISESPTRPTQLTSSVADRHSHMFRAAVDAIAVGVGTVLADDPLLTARGAFRERPLLRVLFDRSLRTPPDARVLSTAEAGPVIIVTSELASRSPRAKALVERGAELLVTDGTVGEALRILGARQVDSLLLEGGAAMHVAAWDAGVVDFVSLYVAPMCLRGGVPFLPDREFSSADLFEREVRTLGPDVLIEGYVHRLD